MNIYFATRRAMSTALAALLALMIGLSGNAFAQQVTDLESEDFTGEGMRISFLYNQHIPGGQGFGLGIGFDVAELAVSRGVMILPSIDIGIAYNIDIDDPDVKHLLQVGIASKLRIAMDLTQPRWVTRVEAIPWFGVTVNGCWSIHETRVENKFEPQNTGWQLCYGPTLGLDLAVGKNMLLTFGLETLFFALGNSGFPNSPFLMAGSQLGIGYKFLF